MSRDSWQIWTQLACYYNNGDMTLRPFVCKCLVSRDSRNIGTSMCQHKTAGTSCKVIIQGTEGYVREVVRKMSLLAKTCHVNWIKDIARGFPLRFSVPRSKSSRTRNLQQTATTKVIVLAHFSQPITVVGILCRALRSTVLTNHFDHSVLCCPVTLGH